MIMFEFVCITDGCLRQALNGRLPYHCCGYSSVDKYPFCTDKYPFGGPVLEMPWYVGAVRFSGTQARASKTAASLVSVDFLGLDLPFSGYYNWVFFLEFWRRVYDHQHSS